MNKTKHFKRLWSLLLLLIAMLMPQGVWASTHYDAGYGSTETTYSATGIKFKIIAVRIYNYQGDNSHFSSPGVIKVTINRQVHTFYLSNLCGESGDKTFYYRGEGKEDPYKSGSFSKVTYQKTVNGIPVKAYFDNQKNNQSVSGSNNGGSSKWCTADLTFEIGVQTAATITMTGSWRDWSEGQNTDDESYSWTFNIPKHTCNSDIQSATSTYLKSAATCTAAAVYYKSCSFCGTAQSGTFTSGSALGHNYGNGSWSWGNDGHSATCTRTCSNDANHKSSVSVTLGNGITSAQQVAPSCTGKGTTRYKATATVEGTQYTATKDVQDIAALGHTYGAGAWSWADDGHTATCTRTCGRTGCTTNTTGHTSSKSVTLGKGIASAQQVAPKCTEMGTTRYTATATVEGTRYSATWDVIDIAALGHSYGAGAWSWADDGHSATCTRTCGRTGCYSNTPGHTSSKSVTLGNGITSEQQVAPNCTTKGTTRYTATATVEGTQYSDTKDVVDIAALSHDYSNVVDADYLVSAATCTQDAKYEQKCSRCTTHGAEWTDEGTMLSHIMTEHAAHDATCTEAGNKLYYTCSQPCCEGKYYKDNAEHTTNAYENQAETVVAASHNYVNGECTVCGNYEGVTTDMFARYVNGTVTITKDTDWSDMDLDVSPHATLIISEGVTLTVDVLACNDATINNYGTLTGTHCIVMGTGKVYNYGGTITFFVWDGSAYIDVDMNTHSWSEWQTIEAASTTQYGTAMRSCPGDSKHEAHIEKKVLFKLRDADATLVPYSGTPATPQQITESNYTDYGFTANNYQDYLGYYAISSADELFGYAQDVNCKNAVLTADILVNTSGSTTYNWVPKNLQQGCTFDGTGHTISGLYCSVGAFYSGLFEFVKPNSTVKNLGIFSSTFNAGETYAGSICAINSGLITNCFAYDITVHAKFRCAGGISGMNGGKIVDCYALGSISADDMYQGEIAGASESGITNCYGNSSISSGADTSGELCYNLNNGKTDGTQAWYQAIGNDSYPVLISTGNNTVYYGYASCQSGNAEYSNDVRYAEKANAHIFANHILTASPVEDGLYAYVCDNGCGTHTDDHIIKDFYGEGNHLELTKSGSAYSTSEDITLADGASFSSPVDFTANSVTYTRTGIKNQWGTLVVPFDVNGIGADYDLYTLDHVYDYELVLTKVGKDDNGGIVPAGTPVLIRLHDDLDGDYDLTLTAANTAVSCQLAEGSKADGLQLVGTYETQELENSDYFISNNKFWNVGDMTAHGVHGVKTAPFRAYLHSTAAGAKAGSLRISIENDNTTTAVETLNAITEGEAEYYDLNGRKLNSLQKGVNIVKYGNGKTIKVTIK